MKIAPFRSTLFSSSSFKTSKLSFLLENNETIGV